MERVVRKLTGAAMRRDAVIPSMIDAIKTLFAEAESPAGSFGTEDTAPNQDDEISESGPDEDTRNEPDADRHA